MSTNGTKYTIIVDKWHVWLLAAMGGILLGFVGFWIGIQQFGYRRDTQTQQRVSKLEGQVHTLLENVQHAGD